MEWVFLTLGIIGLLVFVNLGFYFLSKQGKDPSIKQINRMDKQISTIAIKIDKTNQLLEELIKEIRNK